MIFFDNKSLAKGNVFVRPRSALSYSDTKSYQNLLVDVYGGAKLQEDVHTSSYVLGTITTLSPLSFTYNGIMLEKSQPSKVEEGGGYWISFRNGQSTQRFIYATYFVLTPPTSWILGEGLSLRCLVR